MNSREKRQFRFCEPWRIIIAKHFDVPPDDINMIAIIKCIMRTVRDACSREDGLYDIVPLTREEKKAIYNQYGEKIIDMILTGESPFFDWVDVYEERYVRDILNKMS
ncbi:MAG: hypothetical protein ACTSSP_10335 [Candidatus Asgardarchaeia archaeon]